METAFSCRSLHQWFLLPLLVGVEISPLHLPGQQGRAVLLSGQATTLENFSLRNNVISSLEFY